MTVAELKKMSPEERDNLFYVTPEPSFSGAINTEEDDINDVIKSYIANKIPLDDMKLLKKELSEVDA
uniref:Uncharacterized protein n=1 Tax=uncultured bacterium contig00193 TaxID=1181606 RepID=A0A806KHL4_9BACT|nr:hypothetical protein [uncultured bacterium contig00193]